jgi:signal transduction histidine kinase
MAAKPRNSQGRAEKAAFVVDTQLFRELGELLVGRDATALLELVKNSYDADASVVTVHGDRVASKSKGSIVVTDDGTGMTLAQFRRGFLRLAGRSKTSGERRSNRYGRRYTGEKGVGRLATHKLAQVIEVDSVPRSESGRSRGVRAKIDWGQIERRRTLADAGKAMELSSYVPAPTRAHGTEISLSRLRHSWSEEDLTEFVVSAESFSPPAALVDSQQLRDRLKPSKVLFKTPRVRDQRGEHPDPGFRVAFTGDFAFSSEHWDELTESVEWVLEIVAKRSGVTFCVAPTQRELESTHGHARRQTFEVNHPDPNAGPFFQARIFSRVRGRGSKPFRQWSAGVAGIRIYSEGFRVLPYGNPDNDWLEINRDYAARSRGLRLIAENQQLEGEVQWGEDSDFGLTIAPSDAYVGAVFLTREESGDLEMLVNREGFVPNRAFYNLKDLTRLGTDLLTRARAAGRQHQREAAKAKREQGRSGGGESPSEADTSSMEGWRNEVAARIAVSQERVSRLRASIAAGSSAVSKDEIDDLSEEIEHLATAINALLAEQRLIPVLATVGIQMGEFVHEINGLLAMATTTDVVLDRLRGDPENFTSASARREVAKAQRSARDLRARLERQATYLIDLTTPAAVHRRSSQRLSERLDRAAELVAPALARRSITFVNRIPDEVRTPAMFPAELTAVLLNLMTNAIKAAGEGGRILATVPKAKTKGVAFRLANTGEVVDLAQADRWFRAFETTTTEVDPLLGQGMGFGLPISRGILEEYGAKIEFVQPGKRFSTAIQVEFPS